jgi:hypothetical protein
MMPTINDIVEKKLQIQKKRPQETLENPKEFVKSVKDFLHKFHDKQYPYTTKDIAGHFQWMATHAKKDGKEEELISMLDAANDSEVDSYPVELFKNNVFRMTASKTPTPYSLGSPNIVAARLYVFDGDEWLWRNDVRNLYEDDYETPEINLYLPLQPQIEAWSESEKQIFANLVLKNQYLYFAEWATYLVNAFKFKSYPPIIMDQQVPTWTKELLNKPYNEQDILTKLADYYQHLKESHPHVDAHVPSGHFLEKYIDKFAYDVVDDMSFDDLKERVEEDIRTRAKQNLIDNPEQLHQEMLDFWRVDSLNEVGPDDFKC